MKQAILYLSFLIFVYSCSQKPEEATPLFDNETNTEIITANTTADLELIITQKLQEIYDLQNIYTDSTVSIEIRNQAKKSFSNLLEKSDSLAFIKNPKISNVKITTENEQITFLAGKKPMEADIVVAKKTLKIDGEVIDNIAITIKEIRFPLED